MGCAIVSGYLLICGSLPSRHRSYVNLDTERLRKLLEASFGRGLDDKFFDRTPLAPIESRRISSARV
jgi:acetylglutamate synthase